MRRVALKSIAFRKTRALLIAMAIVLGVSMISGTYVLTDTIHSAFTDIFNSAYKDTSAVISGREIVKDSASGTATVPATLLAKIRRLPSVAAAAGTAPSPAVWSTRSAACSAAAASLMPTCSGVPSATTRPS